MSEKLVTPLGKEWVPGMDVTLPISGSDIPGFKAWINCNGFTLNRQTGRGHDGFDFGAYLREDGIIVIGLPPETPVRAAADGEIVQLAATYGEYSTSLYIEHGALDSGMFSAYVHIRPTVSFGAKVQKGDVLGTLYKDPEGVDGRLVHLHIMLIDGWGTHNTSPAGGGNNLRLQDPALLDPSIYDHTILEQGFAPFDFRQIPGTKGLEIAHFRTVRVGDHVWRRE